MKSELTPDTLLVYSVDYQHRPHWLQSVTNDQSQAEYEASLYGGSTLALEVGLTYYVHPVAHFVEQYGLPSLLELLRGLSYISDREYGLELEGTEAA